MPSRAPPWERCPAAAPPAGAAARCAAASSSASAGLGCSASSTPPVAGLTSTPWGGRLDSCRWDGAGGRAGRTEGMEGMEGHKGHGGESDGGRPGRVAGREGTWRNDVGYKLQAGTASGRCWESQAPSSCHMPVQKEVALAVGPRAWAAAAGRCEQLAAAVLRGTALGVCRQGASQLARTLSSCAPSTCSSGWGPPKVAARCTACTSQREGCRSLRGRPAHRMQQSSSWLCACCCWAASSSSPP